MEATRAASRAPNRPGQFFGEVSRTASFAGLVLSDIVHLRPRRLPEHAHVAAFFGLAVAGDYREVCRRRELGYGRSTVVYHPPGTSHQDEIGPSGAHLFVVELAPAWLERLDALGVGRRALEEPQHLPGGPVHSLALRLYRELYDADACSPLVVEGLMLEMLGETARAGLRRAPQPPAWLGRVRECLEAEPARGWTLASLAPEVGVEPEELSIAFRRFQGETLGEHLRRLRVALVCERLVADPDAGLADLAADAGFADQSHLTRVFRRLTGTTPGAFQAAQRRRPELRVPSTNVLEPQ